MDIQAKDEPLRALSEACNSSQIVVSGKTAQFALLLERCNQARQKLHSNATGRDAVQALLSNLHFTGIFFYSDSDRFGGRIGSHVCGKGSTRGGIQKM
jgi:hypothetical protein